MTDLYGLLIQHINPYVAMTICILLCMGVPYLLGSVNFALVISKVFYHEDIRNFGSGNAGMTNMLRTYGKAAAAGTLFCDMLKASLAVLFGYLIFAQPAEGTAVFPGGYLAGFFCVLGHIFPVFFKFKGGKGVATVAAMVLTLNPLCFVILLAIFVLIVLGTKFVSLGSVIGCMLYPIFAYNLADFNLFYPGDRGFPVLISFAVAATVVFMHRENLKRLKNGTERKISLTKKSKEKKQ